MHSCMWNVLALFNVIPYFHMYNLTLYSQGPVAWPSATNCAIQKNIWKISCLALEWSCLHYHEAVSWSQLAHWNSYLNTGNSLKVLYRNSRFIEPIAVFFVSLMFTGLTVFGKSCLQIIGAWHRLCIKHFICVRHHTVACVIVVSYNLLWDWKNMFLEYVLIN